VKLLAGEPLQIHHLGFADYLYSVGRESLHEPAESQAGSVKFAGADLFGEARRTTANVGQFKVSLAFLEQLSYRDFGHMGENMAPAASLARVKYRQGKKKPAGRRASSKNERVYRKAQRVQ
jgi:hypothetical protein